MSQIITCARCERVSAGSHPKDAYHVAHRKLTVKDPWLVLKVTVGFAMIESCGGDGSDWLV